MRPLVLTALAVAVAAGATPPAAAQPGDKPVIFFSDNPDLKALPERPIRALPLRPNTEQSAFVYVANPGADRDFKVTLQSSRKVGAADLVEPAAEATLKVARGKVERVRFKAPAAPAGAPAGAPVLFNAPTFVLESTDRAGVTRVEDTGAVVELKNPSETMTAKAAVRSRVLTVTLRRVSDIVFGPTAPPAAPLKLTILGANGQALPAALFQREGNSLEGVLDMAANESAAVLVAALPADAKTALVAADGVEGAFAFDIPDGDSDDLRPAQSPPLLPIAPPAVVTGQPLNVAALVVGNDEGEARIVFERVRETAGGPAQTEVRRFPTARDTAKGVRLGGGGELVFAAASKLWSAAIPTAGVYGVRKLRVELAERKGADFEVAFDATAPKLVGALQGLAVSQPTPKAAKLKLRLTAKIADPESGIDTTQGVLFFLGDAPVVKGPLSEAVASPGSPVQLASFGPGGSATYDPATQTATAAAEFELPANLASTVRVGVAAVNRAGQVGVEYTKLDAEALLPPAVTLLEVLPGKAPKEPYKPGQKVIVFATTAKQLRDIDPAQPVKFYVGDAPLPDGTPAPGSDVYPGVLRADPTNRFNVYAAELSLPKVLDKEELKLWVRFVATTGLPAVENVSVVVRPPNGGTIRVKAVQRGERLQPGVPVYLYDGNNRLVGTAVADECGVAKFEDLVPGLYSVQAFKPADANAQAAATMVVRQGQTVDVTLDLKR